MDKTIHIIQNNFFYVPQKKETHTGLKQLKDKKNIKSELNFLTAVLYYKNGCHQSTLKPTSVIPLRLLLLGFC